MCDTCGSNIIVKNTFFHLQQPKAIHPAPFEAGFPNLQCTLANAFQTKQPDCLPLPLNLVRI